MAKQKLYTDACGVFTLHVGRKRYACTSMRLTMALNQIPSASLTIGYGDLLSNKRDNKYGDPEELLATIMSKHKGAYTEMLDCYITEDISTRSGTSSMVIFRGVIATGSVAYRAGTPTVRAIRLMCMHPVCKLFCNPVAMYTYFAGSAIVSELGNGMSKSPDLNAALNSSFASYTKHLDTTALLDVINRLDKNKTDISQIVAMTIDYISRAYTKGLRGDIDTNLDGSETGVLDYMYSIYRVDHENIHIQSNSSFITNICTSIVNAVGGGMSVFDAILRTLASDHFMLNLVPTFGTDFKIAIEPSAAWDVSNRVIIPAEHIHSIDTTYNPIASINSPEAFIVQFNDAFSTQNKETIADMGGQFGIYSVNPVVQTWAKNRFNPNNKAAQTRLNQYAPLVKTTVSTVPTWLYAAFTTTRTSTNNMRSRATKRNPSANTRNNKANTIPDLIQCAATADKIAQALFVHRYGIHDLATVSIDPYLRFGRGNVCLENKIGKPVDIVFNNTEIDTKLNLRGVVESIEYNYAAEGGSSVSYTMKIRCVRPITQTEPSIINPLYAKVTS